jgi:hypothetical protein
MSVAACGVAAPGNGPLASIGQSMPGYYDEVNSLSDEILDNIEIGDEY